MRILFCLFALLFVANFFAQVPQFDKLEQLYDQQHYKMVYRKANFLLDNPTFDYSHVPLYYKTITSLQLCRSDKWRKKHSQSFDDAIAAFEKIGATSKGLKLLAAHEQELAMLKVDLYAWLADLNRRKEKDLSYFFETKIAAVFKGLVLDVSASEFVWMAPSNKSLEGRVAVIEFAKQYIGVPYLWAGESPSGFDCSGFTSFVLANYTLVLPRRAKDQYEAAVKVSAELAQYGDLVFFSNGGEVSHVGILVSAAGKEKVMIHASSSKGITFDKIDGSSYWEKRLVGFGSFIK